MQSCIKNRFWATIKISYYFFSQLVIVARFPFAIEIHRERKASSVIIRSCVQSLHPQLACSVQINYNNLNVMYVILSTVGGSPNQVTHPMHMCPVNVSKIHSIKIRLSNFQRHIFIMETLLCVWLLQV